jgi:transcriptional regulator
MYIPPSHREDRVPVLHDFIERHSLATLVTLSSAGLIASHIPMVLDPEPAPLGTLRGHVSRANPQWRDLAADVQALAIFYGPHHYISPSWYPSKTETGRVVPTWNYVTVHVYGPLRVIEDPDWLHSHLTSLTAAHEAQFSQPWQLKDAPADYIEAMAKGIVGLQLPIKRLEGKWKVSQNRSAADRHGVVAGLRELDTPESNAMATLVMERLLE